MVELGIKVGTIAEHTLSHRWILLGLLLVGHLAFAAACSPMGVRSGQLSVPFFRDPDFPVFVASGATLVHTLALYPLWAGLGPGVFHRRFLVTALLCGAFVSAELAGAWLRGYSPPAAVAFATTLTQFSLVAIVVWLLQRLIGWRISLPGQSQTRWRLPNSRFQLSLRLLLLIITLVASVTAFWQIHFPHGFPNGVIASWRQLIGQLNRGGPFAILAILVLLPTTMIPLFVLVHPRRVKSVIVAAMCWALLDCGIIWVMNQTGLDLYFPYPYEWVLAMQFGAIVPALISSIVIRSSGYRLLGLRGAAHH